MKDTHTVEFNVIFPHGSLCQYPSCEEPRVGTTLFCAGHELHWRANFTHTSETGTDNEREAFFKPYWEKAREEAVDILRVAGCPAETIPAILDKYSSAERESYSAEPSGDGVDLSVPQKMTESDDLEQHIGQGIYRGMRARARRGAMDQKDFLLSPRPPGDLAAEIASAQLTYGQLDAERGVDDEHVDDTQTHIARDIEWRIARTLATTEPKK